MSDLIVKNLNFGDKAREEVFKGITKLTNAVSSTLGASGKCVMLEDNTGKPIITKDGVTVADSVILRNPVENMGATLLKEAARKTVREAGDGTEETNGGGGRHSMQHMDATNTQHGMQLPGCCRCYKLLSQKKKLSTALLSVTFPHSCPSKLCLPRTSIPMQGHANSLCVHARDM